MKGHINPHHYAQVLVAAAAHAASRTAITQAVKPSTRGFGHATHLDDARFGTALHWLRRR